MKTLTEINMTCVTDQSGESQYFKSGVSRCSKGQKREGVAICFSGNELVGFVTFKCLSIYFCQGRGRELDKMSYAEI